ncbi:hypothetical protein D9601_03540 [Sphingomonas sp. MA1305]|uniref:tyrosine-type recombinase/integrase n=1 Tax=Sphingomonas sp. MA1305 TaxID=2479204 RepID=UPI0018DF2E17|nr:site-specific integrase [Sphingomonas sp. MA1305]MBI0474437.1 hypothetical protein [Sphingomonas sp. MA1305]
MAKPGKPLPYIKTVRSRGKVYEYFVTGKVEGGKPVLRRLPARQDIAFGRAYAGMVAARHARESAPSAIVMSDLIRAYQLTPSFKNRAQRTQSTYVTYMRVVEEEMGNAPVSEVERRDVQALLDKMQDRPGAANMVLAVLRNMFKIALKREWVNADPTRDVEFVERGDATHEPWPEQLLMLALADPKVSLPTALLYYTAQRIGDVCQMRWDAIQDGYLVVTQQKTGKVLEIRVHAALAKLLETAPRDAPTIMHRRGKPLRPETLRKRLQAWAANHEAEIVAHGLRKNAVNALLEAGCSVGETAAISGQSLAMVEHYARRRNNRKLGSAAIARWEGAEHA